MTDLSSDPLKPLFILHGPSRPPPPSFIELLAKVVTRFPNRPALLDENGDTTYLELWERAQGIADQLKNLEGGCGEIVPLGFDKSSDYIIALIGTWLAGTAFLPLDPSLPDLRMRTILEDCGSRFVLCPDRWRWRFESVGAVSCVAEKTSGRSFPLMAPKADSPAYLIYTSGSSGTPKGVVVPHRGLTSLFDAQIEAFALNEFSRVLFYLSTSFDASFSDIGTTLLSGACLIILPPSRLAPTVLPQTLRDWRISHADLPPSVLPRLDLLSMPVTFQTVVIGGEVCPAHVVRAWAHRFRVVNVYGPTETTICSSMVQCDRLWEKPFLGAPVPNTTFIVVKPTGEETPPGEGELLIGGDGVALRYHRDAGLTRERFIDLDGKTYYRTGDLVRICDEQNLEFAGRIDRQIKVRGFRIEPAEVEEALLSHPGVRAAAVIKYERLGHPMPAAVIEPQEACPVPPASELREFLMSRLPRWMVPTVIKYCSTLPRTAHGKLDVKAIEMELDKGLPPTTLRLSSEGMDYSSEEFPLVSRFKQIFAQVLGIESVSANDSFFDLGGDSIQAFEVAAAASAEGVPLEPETLFENPTPVKLAQIISKRGTSPDAVAPVKSSEELERDSEPDNHLVDLIRAPRPSRIPPMETRSILLTGATGLLGSEMLLNHLIGTSSDVYCLVRAVSAAAGEKKLFSNLAERGITLSDAHRKRIKLICGDVGLPRLGLPEDRYDELASEVDVVYHCAANVNAALPYEALKTSNVTGTRNVAAFCLTARPKALHYASTLSVFVSTDSEAEVCLESNDVGGTRRIYGGYAQSKWVAERFLHKLLSLGGQDIFIYRFGLITGHSRTGYGRPHDFFNSFLRDILALRIVPVINGEELKMDITPVDYAAEAMFRISTGIRDRHKGIYHIAGSPLSLADLARWAKTFDAGLRNVPSLEWKNALASGSTLSKLTSCRLTGNYDSHRAVDLFLATGVQFDTTNTLQALEGSGCRPPAVDEVLLHRYLTYVRQSV